MIGTRKKNQYKAWQDLVAVPHAKVLGGAVAPIDASGGTKYTPGNGYVYHVFQDPNSDNFVVNSGGGDVNYLLVGGGGAGGSGS